MAPLDAEKDPVFGNSIPASSFLLSLGFLGFVVKIFPWFVQFCYHHKEQRRRKQPSEGEEDARELAESVGPLGGASDAGVEWSFDSWEPWPRQSGTRYALTVKKGKLASTQPGGGIY